MRFVVSSTVIVLAAALTIWPQPGRAQSDRDFVFTDEDGHLVVRFSGTGATGLDESQAQEILNAELSSMVHDRLRADLLFESEPRDADWAASMEPQIEQHFRHAGPEFSQVFVQCRAASCRILMQEPAHASVTQHQAVLDIVQESGKAFIAAQRPHFEPVFMMTAYDQETETPHIKVFLRRAGRAHRAGG